MQKVAGGGSPPVDASLYHNINDSHETPPDTMTVEVDSDKSASVLVLHDEGLDPLPFLARLTGNVDMIEGDVPWAIDNKYYTANVTFEPRSLGVMATQTGAGWPVLIYVFAGQAPNPLPAELTRLVVRDPPPDITLAVRVADLPEDVSESAAGRHRELDEEVFDELGVEVVDECGAADEDDERPLDPLETIRQTLMTHMWPNMVRKPAPGPAGRSQPRPEISVTSHVADSDDDGGVDSRDNSHIDASHHSASFPVLFANHTGPPPMQRQGTASDFPTPEPPEPSASGHGSGAHSSAQYSVLPRSPPAHSDPDSSDEEEEHDGGAYAQMDDDGDDGEGESGEFGDFAQGSGEPSAAEFARLDAWLEDDGDDLETLGRLRVYAEGVGGMTAAEIGGGLDFLAASMRTTSITGTSQTSGSRADLASTAHRSNPGTTEGAADSTPAGDGRNGQSESNGRESRNELEFDDDFGPPPSSGLSDPFGAGPSDFNMPIDPTPLLLHLQNVRAELADVEDEDERRVRAAREVAMLMGQMGLGEGMGLDELEFDDEI